MYLFADDPSLGVVVDDVIVVDVVHAFANLLIS
jgi:hypothetical protein